MNTSTKIDATASQLGKDLGIANAEKGAPPGWIDEAVAVIKSVAGRYPYLISDDLWASGLTAPGNSRALGSAMRAARSAGYIEKFPHFVLTHQATRHRAPVQVWKSKLFGSHPWPFDEKTLLSRAKATT